MFMRFLLVLLGVLPALVVAGPSELSNPGMGFDDHLQQPRIILRPAAAGRVEEYYIGGRLYMIKITPDKGVSYYLVDSDGDGSLETRRAELDSEFAVPQWILKRWK